MRIERESIRSKKRSRSAFNKEGLMRQALCVNPEVWTCSVTKDKTYLGDISQRDQSLLYD